MSCRSRACLANVTWSKVHRWWPARFCASTSAFSPLSRETPTSPRLNLGNNTQFGVHAIIRCQIQARVTSNGLSNKPERGGFLRGRGASTTLVARPSVESANMAMTEGEAVLFKGLSPTDPAHCSSPSGVVVCGAAGGGGVCLTHSHCRAHVLWQPHQNRAARFLWKHLHVGPWTSGECLLLRRCRPKQGCGSCVCAATKWCC